MPKRNHPTEVTINRLLVTLDKYGELLTPGEHDEISHIIFALEEIQSGNRTA